jgi:hypothetical protein
MKNTQGYNYSTGTTYTTNKRMAQTNNSSSSMWKKCTKIFHQQKREKWGKNETAANPKQL